MATESVSEWLRRHELGDYVQRFERENINALRLLRAITDNDLQEMGIGIGDRARFRQAVAETFSDDTHHAGKMSDRLGREIKPRVNSLSAAFSRIVGTDASDEYRSIESELLWMTENWRIIAVVIGVVLVALLLIYFQPAILSLLNTVIANLSSSVSPALLEELTSRVWSLSGIIITATTGSYVINGGGSI